MASLKRSWSYILTTVIIFIYAYLFVFTNYVHAVDEPINSWSSSPSILPNSQASHGATSGKGKVFVIGGANTDDYSNVWISTGNASSGDLASWGTSISLLEPRYWMSTVTREDKIYVLGGASFDGSTSYKDTVFLANIQADGSISSWQTLTSLPQKRALGAATLVNNRIYYTGGFTGGSGYNDIYYADINSDGTLGNWTTSTVTLPGNLFGHSLVAYGNNLILIGGYKGSVSNKTYKTSVNSDGSLTGWQETTAMPSQSGSYRAHVVVVGSTLISVGGSNNSSAVNSVHYTTINSDATLGSWSQSANSLPQAVSAGSMTLLNGYLYLTGGFNGGYLNTVYYTKLNIGIDLNVPLLKQTNPSWSAQVYDSANIWSPSSSGISSWGCALTAAAMVFQYHNIIKLPDGTILNPGTLNTWLKSQKDGYVGTGWVNWIALSRLSKKAKGKNPSFLFDALEYSRVGNNKDLLKQELENNRPGILEVPGHFIVGKGVSGDDFSINDPFYDRTDLSSYANSYISMGRFIPSNTDLSYIMVAGNTTLNFSLKDANGNVVGDAFTQSPLENDQSAGLVGGGSQRMIYLPKPVDTNYSLGVSASTNGVYSFKIFLYDKNGENKIIDQTGAIKGETDTYNILLNSDDVNQSNSSMAISHDILLKDIDTLYALGEIKNQTIYKLLITQVKRSKEQIKRVSESKKLLSQVIKHMDSNKKFFTNNAYTIIKTETQSLINSL